MEQANVLSLAERQEMIKFRMATGLAIGLGIMLGLADASPSDDLSLGKQLEKAGQYAAAAGHFLRAAKSGAHPEAYILLGLCYEELGRNANAIWAYGQVSADKQHGAAAIYYMAVLYLAERRYLEAARIFLSVEKYHANSNWTSPALERAGWCLQQAGKKRRAYQVYLHALELVKEAELRLEIKQRIERLGYYVPQEQDTIDGDSR
jgi:tetratricopeptide (TPR) repeat protein